jgi:hypothetical protein
MLRDDQTKGAVAIATTRKLEKAMVRLSTAGPRLLESDRRALR